MNFKEVTSDIITGVSGTPALTEELQTVNIVGMITKETLFLDDTLVVPVSATVDKKVTPQGTDFTFVVDFSAAPTLSDLKIVCVKGCVVKTAPALAGTKVTTVLTTFKGHDKVALGFLETKEGVRRAFSVEIADTLAVMTALTASPSAVGIADEVTFTVTFDKEVPERTVVPIDLKGIMVLTQPFVFNPNTFKTGTFKARAISAGTADVKASYWQSARTATVTITDATPIVPAVLQTAAFGTATTTTGSNVTLTLTFDKTPNVGLLVLSTATELTAVGSPTVVGNTITQSYTAASTGTPTINATYNGGTAVPASITIS